MRFLLLLAGLLASAATAQPSSAPTDDKTIVVQGHNGAMVRAYVDKVARPAPGRQLARWGNTICVGFSGMAPEFSSFIQARIDRVAKDLHVDVRPKGCHPDAFIMLTDQADAITHRLSGRLPSVQDGPHSGFVQSRREAHALAAPHVIRWLTATVTLGRDGSPILEGVNNLYSSSLIRSATREDVDLKLILIDKDRLEKMTLDQLADYLAFVTFAAPDIGADFANTDSIMALFAGGTDPAPPRMTRQDELLLDGLYTQAADRSPDMQRSALRAHVASGKFSSAHPAN